jgi:pyruvate dehydrogenase E2 component (dihydrolipoamide acetyltransferase)
MVATGRRQAGSVATIHFIFTGRIGVMKYLDALKQGGKKEKKSVVENKMQPGTRMDQNDPMSLVSSPSGRGKKGNTSASSDSADAAIQKLAGELNVDLSTVTGTGPDGQVTEKDVRAAKK